MATWYINADTGNDTTGSGTSGSPWLTISKAHTSATSGDTIICQDSTATYTFSSQTFSKVLTIQGEQDDASGAVFDGAAVGVKWTLDADITIEKITFQNVSYGTAWPGLVFNFSANDITVNVSLCKFANLTIGGRNGFQQFGVFGADAAQSGITFNCERNLFLPTIKSTLASLGFGGSLFNFRSITSSAFNLFNNTISVGEFTGDAEIDNIIETPSASGSVLDMRNNIIYSVENNAINMVLGYTQLSSWTFSYNDYYTTGSAFANVPTGGTGNITSDPLFVDVATDNYNLRPTSPCIDTGVIL